MVRNVARVIVYAEWAAGPIWIGNHSCLENKSFSHYVKQRATAKFKKCVRLSQTLPTNFAHSIVSIPFLLGFLFPYNFVA